MDEDVAYVEAVGSPRALASLQFLGLPLPQDSLGARLALSDRSRRGRPRDELRPAHLALDGAGSGARRSIRLEAPVLNGVIGVEILVEPGPPRRLAGLLAMRPKDRSPGNPLGLVIFLCDALVIAAGGPGELYRDSVYPKQCFGALGMALEAGIEAVNLTESQFGIGTSRDGFPWNLSGHLRAGDAAHLLPRPRRPRARLPQRILPDDPGARLEHLSQRLPVAVPFGPHARLRIEPGRSRDPSRAPGRAARVHGFQPRSRAGEGRRTVLVGPAGRGRSNLSRPKRRAHRIADRAPRAR